MQVTGLKGIDTTVILQGCLEVARMSHGQPFNQDPV